MASIKKKYGAVKYNDLLAKILANNKTKTIKHVGGLQKQTWEKALSKITPDKKAFYIPDVKAIVPRKDLLLMKVQEKGRIINANMREALSGDLRKAVRDFRLKGEPAYIRQRGVKAGTINPKLIKDFESRIKGTFATYTRKDPALGVPANVHAIAVTETRSAINESKMQYMRELTEKNPDLRVQKQWVHNSSLSKMARKNHIRMDGKVVPVNGLFKVPRADGSGHDLMDRPHDQFAPLSQIVSCNCDVIFIAKRV